MRGYAVGQVEESAQECLFLLAISLYFFEIVRPAHYGAKGDDQYVKKFVPLAPIYTEIGNVSEEGLPVHPAKFYLIIYFDSF